MYVHIYNIIYVRLEAPGDLAQALHADALRNAGHLFLFFGGGLSF